ncbi:putative mitochondrial chaperone bcs1 [Sesbania bispinosa]|nr:putative mitochondrial chaperone bcs1 [Sesbania bispinosa]
MSLAPKNVVVIIHRQRNIAVVHRPQPKERCRRPPSTAKGTSSSSREALLLFVVVSMKCSPTAPVRHHTRGNMLQLYTGWHSRLLHSVQKEQNR